MEYLYDHFGVPVEKKMAGMIHYPAYRVWAADYEKDPYRIEWIYFEAGHSFPPLIQTRPHVCFLVKDLEEALQGKKILVQPTLLVSQKMAFVEEKGVPIEFLQNL